MEAHEVASAVAPDLVEPLQPHAPKHPDVLLQAIPLQHRLNLQQGCSLGQHELVVDRQHGLQLRSAQSLAAKFDLGRNFAPGCPSIWEFSQNLPSCTSLRPSDLHCLANSALLRHKCGQAGGQRCW